MGGVAIKPNRLPVAALQPERLCTTSYCLPRLPSFPGPLRSLKLLNSEDLAGLRADMCLTKELVALVCIGAGEAVPVFSALTSLSCGAGEGAAACIPDGERHPEEAASLSLARCLRVSDPFCTTQALPHTKVTRGIQHELFCSCRSGAQLEHSHQCSDVEEQ